MENSIDKSDIKINPEAVVSVHEGGVVILDNSKGRLYSSGPAGAYIWRCIERRLSLEAMPRDSTPIFRSDSRRPGNIRCGLWSNSKETV